MKTDRKKWEAAGLWSAAFLFSTAVLSLFVQSACRNRHEIPASPANFTVVELDPAAGGLAGQLKAEAVRARRSGRKPFVEFYAKWCGPCKALAASLNAPQMADAFDGVYLIRLDVDAWKSALPGTGFSAPPIPVFYELDGEGRPTGRKIDGGAWGEDVPANMAPPMKSFFKPELQFPGRSNAI